MPELDSYPMFNFEAGYPGYIWIYWVYQGLEYHGNKGFMEMFNVRGVGAFIFGEGDQSVMVSWGLA